MIKGSRRFIYTLKIVALFFRQIEVRWTKKKDFFYSSRKNEFASYSQSLLFKSTWYLVFFTNCLIGYEWFWGTKRSLSKSFKFWRGENGKIIFGFTIFFLMYFFFKQVVRIIAYFVLKTKFLVSKILCRKNVQFCTAMH